jgi:pleckstrin homology domain-containing family A member 1/2
VEPYLVSEVNYTFKVFTPKKTFLLCAPSEEEEVSWISAIRVLIARRTKEAENASAATDEAKKLLSKPGSGASKVMPNTAGAPKSSATAVTAA